MAELNSDSNTNEGPLATPERVQIATEAAWEAESCAIEALKILNSGEETLDVRFLPVRGLLLRLQNLANISMAALQDEHEAPADLWRQLTGVKSAEREVSHG